MLNLESLAQKMSGVILNLVISAVSPPPPMSVVFEGFQIGSILHSQISPGPDVPQFLFTPQNVAIDQGINLRVVPTSSPALIVVEVIRSRFILFVSHQTSLKEYSNDRTHRTHTS